MSNKIKCLVCGKFFARVCTHVRQKHDMSAREYKEHFGLDVKRGIMTEEDREIMREHTTSNGTIKNLKKGAKYRFKRGHSQNYVRSDQTMKRLKEHFARISKHNNK